MLRITSKKVRDAVDKLCPPTHVKLCATFLHNAVNFTSAFYYTVDATQKSAEIGTQTRTGAAHPHTA